MAGRRGIAEGRLEAQARGSGKEDGVPLTGAADTVRSLLEGIG